MAEVRNQSCGRNRNLRDLVGSGVDVDRGVAAEDDALVEHQHIEAAGEFGDMVRADHFERGPHRFGVVLAESAHDAVRVADRHHDAAEVDTLVKALLRLRERKSLSLAQVEQVFRVPLTVGRRARILDANAFERDAPLFSGIANLVGAAEQNGMRDALVDDDLRCAQDLEFFAFREDDALGVLPGTVDDAAHEAARGAEPEFKSVAIVLEVDHLARDAAGDGSPGDGRCHPEQRAWIERKRDQVFRSELD